MREEGRGAGREGGVGKKARFSKVVDIAEDRGFWRKGKALVDL